MAVFKKVKEENFIDLCETGTVEEIRKVIDSDIDVNGAYEDGFTAIMGAARGNTAEVCKFLLGLGANVNAQGYDGNTALIWAAGNNTFDVVEVLVESWR